MGCGQDRTSESLRAVDPIGVPCVYHFNKPLFTRRFVPSAMILQESDRERFLQELEEDPDMRQRINIYKDEQRIAQLQQQQVQQQGQQQQRAPAGAVPGLGEDMEDEDEDDGDLPQVPLEELLDDLVALNIDHGEHGAGAGEEDGGGDMDMD